MHISSDTNIWIDFQTIDALSFPFRLDHSYFMSADAIEDELLNPPGLGKQLVALGLLPLELTTTEFFAVLSVLKSYPQLSRYDAAALVVARERGYVLLTGDKRLRGAGISEGVTVRGTLWILDELEQEGRISREEYDTCLTVLLKHNGGMIRLPVAEIHKRMQKKK